MTARVWASLAVACLLVCTNESSKILVVFFFPEISHNILGNGYVRHLLHAGHEVTYITTRSFQKPSPMLHQIHVQYPEYSSERIHFKLEAILKHEVLFKDYLSIFNGIHDMSKYFLNQRDVQKLINDPEQTFDLVIVEWMYTEVHCGFSALFRCPLIWATLTEPHWMLLRLVDEMPNPAYVPDFNSYNSLPLSLLERADELWTQIKILYEKSVVEPKNDLLYEEVFSAAGKKRGIILPPLREVKFNASFVLSNSHVSLGDAVRLPQNFIPIAGYHMDPKPEPLTEDLKKIMDTAEDGVIYFSMGSNLKCKFMPDKMKKEFLETFSQLKQTVIWKIEETLPDLPKNVHLMQWAPQQSILAHPKCVLSITHGGLPPVTETVHYAVPIIGIPVFADQFNNVNRAVSKGFALKVDLSYDTPKKLGTAIQEILNNPGYRERVKHFSLVYHDRPVPPGKELVHWVEHAIKTRGAPHLRSRALSTPWYQKTYLDLAALIMAIICCLCFTVKYFLGTRKSSIDTKKTK
ncbi:UDP-glucuronosyltransferase 2B31 [Eumeta japonica]|uniref:UDP-glucuronosyltransferase 2B31 n=1 Tax=Eumeta variegata TaxID=151549 RepID=A0A4C1TLY9_EUMVA|nr:UDP-glucuronosyltransferase 2B31 [Eumeta japonica]